MQAEHGLPGESDSSQADDKQHDLRQSSAEVRGLPAESAEQRVDQQDARTSESLQDQHLAEPDSNQNASKHPLEAASHAQQLPEEASESAAAAGDKLEQAQPPQDSAEHWQVSIWTEGLSMEAVHPL